MDITIRDNIVGDTIDIDDHGIELRSRDDAETYVLLDNNTVNETAWDDFFLYIDGIWSDHANDAWDRTVLICDNQFIDFIGHCWDIYGIESFVPGRRGLTREEVDAWAADLRALGERGEYFFSVNRYLFVTVKPGRPDEI